MKYTIVYWVHINFSLYNCFLYYVCDTLSFPFCVCLYACVCECMCLVVQTPTHHHLPFLPCIVAFIYELCYLPPNKQTNRFSQEKQITGSILSFQQRIFTRCYDLFLFVLRIIRIVESSPLFPPSLSLSFFASQPISSLLSSYKCVIC